MTAPPGLRRCFAVSAYFSHLPRDEGRVDDDHVERPLQLVRALEVNGGVEIIAHEPRLVCPLRVEVKAPRARANFRKEKYTLGVDRKHARVSSARTRPPHLSPCALSSVGVPVLDSVLQPPSSRSRILLERLPVSIRPKGRLLRENHRPVARPAKVEHLRTSKRSHVVSFVVRGGPRAGVLTFYFKKSRSQVQKDVLALVTAVEAQGRARRCFPVASEPRTGRRPWAHIHYHGIRRERAGERWRARVMADPRKLCTPIPLRCPLSDDEPFHLTYVPILRAVLRPARDRGASSCVGSHRGLEILRGQALLDRIAKTTNSAGIRVGARAVQAGGHLHLA